MPILENTLQLKRCPHCQIADPNITKVHEFATTDSNGRNKRLWVTYRCVTCGGAIIGSHEERSLFSLEMFPQPIFVDECIPLKAREFLNQAISTFHAPSGSIMLSASSIDAMLKDKGYKDGNLHSRIRKAASDHLITKEMAEWADLIRLEANDQRHADENSEMPKEINAKKIVEFALALAQFLYVLPNRVMKGIETSKE